MELKGWEKVWEAESKEEAYLLKAFLENNDIPVRILGEPVDSIFPNLYFARLPVWVPDEKADEALDLIHDFYDGEEEES